MDRHLLLRISLLFLLLIVIGFGLFKRLPAQVMARQAQQVPMWALYMPLVMQEGKNEGVISDGYASWGAPLALSPADGTLWVVNPDAGSVTVMNQQPFELLEEIAVGEEPWSLAISPNGHSVYVADRAAGEVVVIDAAAIPTASRSVRARVTVGAELGAIALNPTGSRAYITSTATDEVLVMDTDTLDVVSRLSVAAKPYAIAVTDDGDGEDEDERVYVTHFLALQRAGGVPATDNGREGRLSVLDAGTNALLSEIVLAPDEHGFPNLLAGVAIAGNRAWVPQVRAAPDSPVGLTTTVFAAVSSLDLTSDSEDLAAHLPLNDQDIFGSPVNNPMAAIPSPDGQTLYIVLGGSDLVEVVDVSLPEQPRLVRFISVGKNPRGMAISHDGRWGYVMNYLSRSVTKVDLIQLILISEVSVTSETLSADLLRGKILFHNASEPKLSQGSWVSCASCHPDGNADGVTWIFPDGPRQSPPLWNATQTLPWHWSAALDEPQDVEDTIEVIQHGLGLAPGTDPLLLASPNAGRSADLDALATFMAQGIRIPNTGLSATNAAQGRKLFESAGCAACHGGPNWTISAMPGLAGTLDPDENGMVDDVLRDVGTLNPRDLRGETGFDVPSLLAVGLTAPYLHDGSMPTLEALLASGHPSPNGNGNGLDEEEIADLVDFLRGIGAETEPIRVNSEQ